MDSITQRLADAEDIADAAEADVLKQNRKLSLHSVETDVVAKPMMEWHRR